MVDGSVYKGYETLGVTTEYKNLIRQVTRDAKRDTTQDLIRQVTKGVDGYGQWYEIPRQGLRAMVLGRKKLNCNTFTLKLAHMLGVEKLPVVNKLGNYTGKVINRRTLSKNRDTNVLSMTSLSSNEPSLSSAEAPTLSVALPGALREIGLGAKTAGALVGGSMFENTTEVGRAVKPGEVDEFKS